MMRYVSSMELTNSSPQTLKPKVGRVPAAPAPARVYTPPSYPTFLRRSMLALGCAVLFLGVTAFSVGGGKGLGRVSVSDAIASTTTPDPSQEKAHKPGSVVIQEGNGTIVGQMTKISPEMEQVTEIKTASRDGKSTSEDLLSIVGKY